MGYSQITMRYADIAVAAPTMQSFTYGIPPKLEEKLVVGMRVAVPFRRRKAVGYVIGVGNTLPKGLEGKEVRSIDATLDDDPVFSSTMLAWLSWMARYYCAPIGEVCRAALPSRLTRIELKKKMENPEKGIK